MYASTLSGAVCNLQPSTTYSSLCYGSPASDCSNSVLGPAVTDPADLESSSKAPLLPFPQSLPRPYPKLANDMQHNTTSPRFFAKTGFSEHLLVWSPYSHRDELERETSIDLSASITKNYYSLSSAVQSKRMRNALAPISTLPVELLSRVFVFTENKLPEELSALTQVCHHWRAVALNTANLWTRIPCDNSFHMEEHLKRSKALALDVTLFLTQEEEEEHPSNIESPVYVLCHLHRIERLTVELVADNTPGQFKTFNALCHKAAPRLRYLQLTSNDGVDWGTAESTAFIFPNAQLSHLKLYQVAIFPNSHLLSVTLTYLHIQNLQSYIDPSELRDVLKRMPLLEHLHLQEALSPQDPPDLVTLEPAHLPSLKVLTVREDGNMCIANFFKLTTFPGSLEALSIRVEVDDDDELVAMVRGIMDACTDWEAFWSYDIHSLKMAGDIIDDERYLCFRGLTRNGAEKLSLELPYYVHTPAAVEIHPMLYVADIHSLLFISGTHRIKMVSWDFTASESMMRDAFQLCPDLENITVSGDAITELGHCLADPELRAFTQQIVEIVIVDVWNQADGDNEAEGPERQSQMVELDKLIDVFAIRRDSGQKIQRVTFSNGTVSSDTHDRLRGVVGNVHVVEES